MSDDEINRRSVLQSIGGTAATAGALSTLSVNVAAAEAVDGDVVEADPVTILDGYDKLSVAAELARTRQFGLLLREARSQGYSLQWHVDEIYAGRTEAGSFRREVASFNLRGAEGDEHAAIHVGRDPTDDSVVLAAFDVEQLDGNGVPERTVRYVVADPSPDADVRTTERPGDAVERTVIESDPETRERFVQQVGQQAASAQGASTTDFPVELDISTCSGCYYAATLVCRNLCGAGGGFLCGLLGISIVGGVSCVTFVGAVCWVAGKLPQCADPVAATICKGTGLGICGPNEKPGSPIEVDIPQF